MANTITNTTLITGHRKVVKYIALDSDGSQETATVIYDSSVIATANGKPDPLKSRILSAHYVTSSVLGVVKLLWDATTDVLALSMPQGGNPLNLDLKHVGGLKNTAGAGITGDISITTTGLAAGDSLTLVLVIDPEYQV